MKITKSNILNLIKTAFGFEWTPEISQEAIDILNRCDSTTEQVYFLGAAYYIESMRDKYKGELFGQPLPISSHIVTYNQINYEAIYFQEPWGGWARGYGAGPSSCAFVPQLKFPYINYHHDFGLFYSADNAGGEWGLQCAIEIDPDKTHKDRRDKDEYRDSIVDYEVIRVDDKTHSCTTWFELIMDRDDAMIEKHLSTITNDDGTQNP